MSRFGKNTRHIDIVHSHAMARTGNNTNIGSSSNESFQARMSTETNRTTIGAYKSANLHTDYRALSARPLRTGTKPDISTTMPRRPTTKHSGFSEPTSRGFNPYK